MKPVLCTDMTKQHEFVSRLSTILDKPDSTIAVAFLADKGVYGSFLFFATESQVKKGLNTDVKYSCFEFDFVYPFTKNPSLKNMITSSGISTTDLAELTDLFDDYTFINPAEGKFFASKFFYNESAKINSRVVYLKFKADERLNTFFIDGKNLYRSYGFGKTEKLVELVEPAVAPNTLAYLAPNTMSKIKDKNFAMASIKAISYSDVVCEIYLDMSTGNQYVGNIFKLVDGEVIEKPLTDIL